MRQRIDHNEGRRLFGLDPAGYDAARPPYPEALYRFLTAEGAIRPNTRTLEIGAGTGIASRRLLELGANPLTLLEPDERIAPSLDRLVAASSVRVKIVHRAFEDYDAPAASFELIAAATSFHWVHPSAGVPRLARYLLPGGHAALWWNVLQVLDKPDPFHDATRHLLQDLAVSPTGAPNTIPFALDRAAREADFARSGAFEPARYHEVRWTHVLDTEGVGRLYGGFSHIQRLDTPTRRDLLDALMRIADAEFGGRVERNVTSVMYLFRRNDAG